MLFICYKLETGREPTDTFRICIVDIPLSGSQAAFVHRNHFTFQRGAQLRDQLLLRAGERLPGGIVLTAPARRPPVIQLLI